MSKAACPNCEATVYLEAESVKCPECGTTISKDNSDANVDVSNVRPQAEQRQGKARGMIAAVVTLVLAGFAGAIGKQCGNALFPRTATTSTYAESKAKWSRQVLPDVGISNF
jgi:endogenous inhibitor of DNA gyrase (YacG/DUF329 family)